MSKQPEIEGFAGLRVDGERAMKRISLARNLRTLLDATGLDTAQINSGGFTAKLTRTQYDDTLAKPEITSPPGMHLVVARDGGYDVFSSEALTDDVQNIGRMDINGVEYAPSDHMMLTTTGSEFAILAAPARVTTLTARKNDVAVSTVAPGAKVND